jgi:hypothetical protein
LILHINLARLREFAVKLFPEIAMGDEVIGTPLPQELQLQWVAQAQIKPKKL